MSSHLHDLAVFDDINTVGVLYRGKTVSDDDTRSTLLSSVKGVLNNLDKRDLH